ncbi:hypothetical protein FGX02_00275, partial [Xylella fastidiosa subsp. multiplex]|nr:hypothetical protein [Xylella fastidiosa subsp. multiplex]
AITACNHEEAFAFTFDDRGHQVHYLTFPDGMTWGFDIATREWHRRESCGVSRWRMNACVRWAADWVAGDFANGKLYTL